MFQWLIVHTIVAAALAVVAAAANRCFRLGAAARHLLWLVVLLKLMAPPVLYWPWSLPRFVAAPVVSPTAEVTPSHSPSGVVRTVIIDLPPQLDGGPSAADPTPSVASAEPVEVKSPAAAFSWEWLSAALGWTWLAGAVAIALRHGMRIVYWRRRLARGGSAPDGLKTLLLDLAGSMGVRPPRIVVLAGASSPMLWGFGAPLLIWPVGLEDRLSAEGRRAVILHELAHLKRRDHWVGWLLLAGACVWWWHPLFWWVRGRLGLEAELACDAQVIATAPEARRAYAEALLEVCQQLTSAAAVPALGAAGGRRDLERRLVMIMRGPAARRLSWGGLIGVGLLGLLALPAWTLGENPPASGPKLPAVSPSAAPLPPPSAPIVPPPGVEVSPPAVDPAPAPPTPSAGSPALSAAVGAPSPPPPTVDPGRPPVASGAPVEAPLDPQAPAAVPPSQVDGGEILIGKTKRGHAPAEDAYRDNKLRELDAKVQQLLKEMQQLRGQKSPPGAPGLVPNAPTPAEGLVDFLLSGRPDPLQPPAAAPPSENPTEVITLTRVAYKLKPTAATALASFLKDNVKTDILETKIDGENLVVTTTPEAQHAIGQFIGLIQGKTPMRSGMMGPGGGAPPLPSVAVPGTAPLPSSPTPAGTPFSGPDAPAK